MDDAQPARPIWPLVAVGLAGLWILTGGVLKLLIGTPQDLPRIVQDLPFALRTTYRLVIGVELFVGLLGLTRPARAWPLVLLLLGVFVLAATKQMMDGTTSCGCFGGSIHVPPWVMLVVDLALMVVILASGPWRLRGGPVADLAFAGGALVLAVALPLLPVRESVGVGKTFTVPADWVGQPILDTELGKRVDLAGAPDGKWVFYVDTCPVCANCLAMWARDGVGEQPLVLLRMPPKEGEAPEVHLLPDADRRFDLPDTIEWAVQPPAEMIVKGGRVVSVRSIELDECP